MLKKKENREFYLLVEGSTERWYFEHIKALVSGSPSAKCKISYKFAIKENPESLVKNANIFVGKVFQIFDYEGNDKDGAFERTLESVKKAKKLKGKNSIDYKIGYSNLSFDLWIILHKKKTYESSYV
ncbi:MAG: RloB family protein [Endomicrobium sp.]|jgi:hypothetical protein|nr:RloB family protein [Endomicrobium sp.]